MNTNTQNLEGATILLTGGAGFVGSAVLHRLLSPWTDPNLPSKFGKPALIIAIIRGLPSLSKGVVSRLPRELQAFATLGKQDQYSPLVVLEGDVSLPGFGILNVEGQEEAAELLKQVEVVIHCAADVKFSHPLPKALRANAGIAFAVAEFATGSPNVKTCIFVSTCYTGLVLPHGSTFLPDLVPEVDPSIKLRDQISTYSHSKNIAEGIFQAFARSGSTGVAFAIVRLSTVTPAIEFPYTMWGSESTGSPLCSVIAADPLPESVLHPDGGLDCIPVDICVNQLLQVTTEAHWNGPRHEVALVQGQKAIKIHHACSVTQMPFTLINSPHIKLPNTFIKNAPFLAAYGPMLDKVVVFQTTPQAKEEVQKAFENLGGFESYCLKVRERMIKVGETKRRKKLELEGKAKSMAAQKTGQGDNGVTDGLEELKTKA
ncbi:hypothetical protein T439DRAFT_381797 [Meredithblackwellia eburnea MCA 4105]